MGMLRGTGRASLASIFPRCTDPVEASSSAYDQPVVEKPRSTDTERLYASLHAELLNGGFSPGCKLKTTGIAARYEISLSVVREALIRLVADGLVRAVPQRGFCVAPLSPEDLLDLTQSRVLIETATLRRAIDTGDLAWESAVLAAHHALRETPRTSSNGEFLDTWAQAHDAFHRALLTGARSPRLESLATKLRNLSRFYHHGFLPNAAAFDVSAEDGTIAELAVARDSIGAVQALKDHLERDTAVLLATGMPKKTGPTLEQS